MDFEHRIITHKMPQEAEKWCTDHFGPKWVATKCRTGTWCVFWSGRGNTKGYQWYFKNEKDATMFVLRWS